MKLSRGDCERRWRRWRREEEEEEEEAVFIRGVNTNEDPPNAHQAQHRRRRRRSLLVNKERKLGGSVGAGMDMCTVLCDTPTLERSIRCTCA